MNSKLKTGLIIGAGVLGALIVYEFATGVATGVANGVNGVATGINTSDPDGSGPPTVSDSIKYGTMTVTAAGSAWVIVALLGALL
jgi:hypothetical protein